MWAKATADTIVRIDSSFRSLAAAKLITAAKFWASIGSGWNPRVSQNPRNLVHAFKYATLVEVARLSYAKERASAYGEFSLKNNQSES